MDNLERRLSEQTEVSVALLTAITNFAGVLGLEAARQGVATETIERVLVDWMVHNRSAIKNPELVDIINNHVEALRQSLPGIR
jgi:hypothetical protein